MDPSQTITPQTLDLISKTSVATAAIIALILEIGLGITFLVMIIKIIEKIAVPLFDAIKELNTQVETNTRITEQLKMSIDAQVITTKTQGDAIQAMSRSVDTLSKSIAHVKN